MNARALNRATLARQALIARERDPLAMIERLVGLQAQQARPPFVGLWTRVEKFQREQLHALVRDKAVVRATMMRGTLHLVTAADYVAMRGAMQPMFDVGVKSILGKRVEGLDVAKLCAFARTRLPATFEALRPVLAKKFPKFDDRALGFAVRMKLPLVQVPTGDRWAYPASSDFACAETWLGRAIDPGMATTLLVKRYLAAFGPATVRDAQTWSGLGDLAPAFAALRDELVTFRDGKRELFDLPDAPRPDPDTAVPVRFLPEFDNLVLSHDDRSRVIALAHRPAVVTKNLQVKATFLVDGVVAGTWTVSLDRRKKAATLVLSPFAALNKPARAALEAEGELLLRFVEPDAASYAIKVA
jgi:hypothetical protein